MLVAIILLLLSAIPAGAQTCMAPTCAYETKAATGNVSGLTAGLVPVASGSQTNPLNDSPMYANSGNVTLKSSTLTVQGNAFSVNTQDLAVSGGKVGIGTTSPGTTLDVNGASSLRGAVTVAGSSLTVRSPDNGTGSFAIGAPGGPTSGHPYTVVITTTLASGGSITLWSGNFATSLGANVVASCFSQTDYTRRQWQVNNCAGSTADASPLLTGASASDVITCDGSGLYSSPSTAAGQTITCRYWVTVFTP